MVLSLLVGSATLVAVTYRWGGFGMRAGPVYRPELVMVPMMMLPPGNPPALHVTAVFELPVTVAVNCRVELTAKFCGVEGETVTLIKGIIVTEALPLVTPSAVLVAVTVTWEGFGIVAGAV
jgi:hypothetical protein